MRSAAVIILSGATDKWHGYRSGRLKDRFDGLPNLGYLPVHSPSHQMVAIRTWDTRQRQMCTAEIKRDIKLDS